MTDYLELTQDEQSTMLRTRLHSYEQQHFDATQNLRMSRATRGDETTIALLEKKICDLETCIGIVTADLAAGGAAASSELEGASMIPNDGSGFDACDGGGHGHTGR